MRPLAVALIVLAPIACGGKDNTTCPADYVCTPMPEGGTTPPGGAGATAIATQIQATATNLASDGTSLYWTSSEGSGGPVSSVPVVGGAVSTVVTGQIGGGFLAVDSVNVYYPAPSGGYSRSSKSGGGAATLITPAGANVFGFTMLGGNAYWVEQTGNMPMGGDVVKTAPAQGGPTSVLATMAAQGPSPGGGIAVTTTTVFVPAGLAGLSFFSIASGIPDGGTPTLVTGLMGFCEFIVSDTSDVYCSEAGSIVAIASDGSTSTLGNVLNEGQTAGGGGLAADDTYVYWVDATTVGTIMRAPKSGGAATIIARDTSPVAIAVDASAVYWSDVGGNIMRLPK
ncbi:MAG TPA: hypothetical protein VGL81_07190 [Polyangiaceae bacterium]|jgi:hypothetical protein